MKTIKEDSKVFVKARVCETDGRNNIYISIICEDGKANYVWVGPDQVITEKDLQKWEKDIKTHQVEKKAEAQKNDQPTRGIILYNNGKMSGGTCIAGMFKADYTENAGKMIGWLPVNTREIAKVRLHAAIDNLNIAKAEFPKLREELHKAVEEV